jgi:hypothetical protein
MQTPERGKKSDQQALGTAGRVSSRKKKARPFGESKLPFYIDSSGFYYLAKEYRIESEKTSSETKRSITDIMDCYCSEYGAEELSRRANFKGGLTLKLESESVSVQYSREEVGNFTTFKSELDLDQIRREVLPLDSPFTPFFQSYSVDFDKKEFVHTLLPAMGYYFYTLDSSIELDIEKRDIIKAAYNEIKDDFEDLPDLDSMFVGDIPDNINSFLQMVNNEINVPSIGSKFDSAYLCDSRNFSSVNEKLLQDSICDGDNTCPFYVIYRMGYTTKVQPIHENDGVSSPSPEKVGYNRYKQTSTSINNCVANFAIYIYNNFKQQGAYSKNSNEFKKAFKTAYTSLLEKYIEFDMKYHDLVKSRDYNLEDIKTSEEYLGLISELSAFEEKVIIENFGEGITLFQFKKHFYDYLLDNTSQNDKYLDKNFDANDFSACWDSIANGLPLLTNNSSLIKQTRSNLTRSFLLGRDVQVVVIEDVVRFFKNADPFFTVLDITEKHLWEYCYENLDMTKLWGMTSSAKGVQFSQEYNGFSWNDSLSDDVSGTLFPGRDDFKSDFPDLKLGTNDSEGNTIEDKLGSCGLFKPINHATSVESDKVINPTPKSGGGGKK